MTFALLTNILLRRPLFFMLLLCLPLMPTSLIRAQTETPITYERYDVEFILQQNGNFIVRELQQIRFEGQYSQAFAEIPLDYALSIENVQVKEGTRSYEWRSSPSAGTYSYEKSGQSLFVEWHYEQTKAEDVRTFVLEYEVIGGLWVYDKENILEWRAVPADRSGFPVEESRVTVKLPQPVAADALDYTAFGAAFEAQAKGDEIIFEATEPLADGIRFQVMVGFPPDLVAAARQPWQSKEEQARLDYSFKAIEVDLFVDGDGIVTVDEQQHLAVTGGLLSQGERTIQLAYLDEISNVEIWEGGQRFEETSNECNYCFVASEKNRHPDWIRYDSERDEVLIQESRAGQLDIKWHFPELVKGEETTFWLSYHVAGLIVADKTGQRFDWTAVFGGRTEPVEEATVRLHLPPAVNASDVEVSGGTRQDESEEVILITHNGALQPHESWEISVSLPPNATIAPKAAWQENLESARLAQEEVLVRQARMQLGAGVASLLILVGGLLGVWLLWYRWGRDTPVELVAEYLSEPPSKLPPGIVAYLVDEDATPKGALSSLFHLATLGLLRIKLAKEITVQSNWPKELVKGQSIENANGTQAIPDHLVTLFNRLSPAIPLDKEVRLADINKQFQQALPAVYIEMGEEASRFFAELPAKARHRWLVIGQWLVLASIILSLVCAFLYLDDLGWIALAPSLALLPVGLLLMLISRWMPQRTSLGAEEAARWQAFKRYLLNLKEYGNLSEAQKVLDEYFAYALALDVEDVVLKQADSLGSRMPSWTFPVDYEPSPHRHTSQGRQNYGSTTSSQPQQKGSLSPSGATLPNIESQSDISDKQSEGLPTLDGLSEQLSNALNNASNNLATLLNRAAGDSEKSTPFKVIIESSSDVSKGPMNLTWNATSTTFEIIGDILDESATGGGSGGYSSSSSRRSNWSSSSSRRRSSSSRRRSSSSRRRSSSSRRSSSKSSGRSSSSPQSGGGSNWSSSSSRPSSSSSRRSSSRSSGRSSKSRRSGGGGGRGFK